MPPLTRWFIRTSFVYFILALLAGVILGAQAVWAFNPPAADLFPSYFHLLAEGWITMLIIGVVFWMFPKYTLEEPHGSERLGWASYILLNLGLLLRIISEPVNGVIGTPASVWAILLTLAALLQWLGGMAFVLNSWARVKEK
jgi:cbb3-type cytochrome oxidase subunit 1